MNEHGVIEDFVLKIDINKKNKLLVCIPTYKTFEVTKNTVNSFLNQKDIAFDICIIGSTDEVAKLKKEFPILNIVLLKSNYGATGAYFIAAKISQKYNYEYTMLNDNEAVFLEDTSLKKLMDFSLKNSAKVCAASSYDSDYGQEIYQNAFICPFHCCLLSNEIFEKTDLFNFHYFLLHDDFAFWFNIRKKYNIFVINNIKMYHPVKLSFYKFDNFMKYIFLRASLIGLFYERWDYFSKRMFLNFFFLNFVPILYSIVNFDFTFFKIIYITVKQFIRKDFSIPDLPKAKYAYREVGVLQISKNDLKEFPKLNIFDRIFLPKFLSIEDSYKNEVKVYAKYKQW